MLSFFMPGVGDIVVIGNIYNHQSR